MDFQTILGYLSGLYFIRTDFATSGFWRTALLLHLLDAVLCRLIAAHEGRRKNVWTIAGLCLGIWAVATLFLLPEKKPEAGET